jgi:hypothetical protein
MRDMMDKLLETTITFAFGFGF